MKGSLDHLENWHKWLMHMRPLGGPSHGYLKCFTREELCVNSPWGLGASCKKNKKIKKISPYVTTKKAIITNPWWLNVRLFIFLQLVRFLLLVMYVQASMDSLNKMFLDLHGFNKSKVFNPKYDPSDEEVHITMSEEWLERLITNLWINGG